MAKETKDRRGGERLSGRAGISGGQERVHGHRDQQADAYPRKVRNRGSVARLASMVKDRKAGLTRCTGCSMEKSSSTASSVCAGAARTPGEEAPRGPRSSSSSSSGGGGGGSPNFKLSSISGSPGCPTQQAAQQDWRPGALPPATPQRPFLFSSTSSLRLTPPTAPSKPPPPALNPSHCSASPRPPRPLTPTALHAFLPLSGDEVHLPNHSHPFGMATIETPRRPGEGAPWEERWESGAGFRVRSAGNTSVFLFTTHPGGARSSDP